MILVDFKIDDERAAERLDTLLARWAQSVRFTVSNIDPRVTTGDVRGHVLNTSSEGVLAAMALAHKVLTDE